MTPYKELRWPRFWPFLRIKEKMPSHRLRLPWAKWIRAWDGPCSWFVSVDDRCLVVGTRWGELWVGLFRFIEAPPRDASNYLVTIVAKRGLPEYTLQQEIYESRYWLRHLHILIWIGYCYHISIWEDDKKRAAAHLARVECWSRQQEIRARFYAMYGEYWLSPPDRNPSRKEVAEMVMAYAKSIVSAKNYVYFSAAGWSEMDAYNEINGGL